MTWLISNWGTILVVLILAAVVVAIVRSLRKDRKSGKNSCGCDCNGCTSCGGSCHPKNCKAKAGKK